MGTAPSSAQDIETCLLDFLFLIIRGDGSISLGAEIWTTRALE